MGSGCKYTSLGMLAGLRGVYSGNTMVRVMRGGGVYSDGVVVVIVVVMVVVLIVMGWWWW